MPTSYALTLTASDLTSQGTLNNLKALPAPDASGTQGVMTLAGGASDSVAMYTEPNVPGLTEWPTGDYTHSHEIDDTGADITYTLSLRRVSSTGTLLQTLGTSGTLSGTGIKSFTVNVGSPIATNAGDRLVGVLTGTRGASHGNQTLTASFNGANDLLVGAWTAASNPYQADLTAAAFDMDAQSVTRLNAYVGQISAAAMAFSAQALTRFNAWAGQLSAPSFGFTGQAVSWSGLASFVAELSAASFAITGQAVSRFSNYAAQLTTASMSLAGKAVTRLSAYAASLATATMDFSAKAVSIPGAAAALARTVRRMMGWSMRR